MKRRKICPYHKFPHLVICSRRLFSVALVETNAFGKTKPNLMCCRCRRKGHQEQKSHIQQSPENKSFCFWASVTNHVSNWQTSCSLSKFYTGNPMTCSQIELLPHGLITALLNLLNETFYLTKQVITKLPRTDFAWLRVHLTSSKKPQ